MNIYVALGLIVSLLISAGICVYKAYRIGLRDGLDIGRTNRMRDPVVVRKEDKKEVEKIEGKSTLEQVDKMLKF